MCSCHAPAEFLRQTDRVGLPELPTELQNLILSQTHTNVYCRVCCRLVARSRDSACRVHASAIPTCVDCSKGRVTADRSASAASTTTWRRPTARRQNQSFRSDL